MHAIKLHTIRQRMKKALKWGGIILLTPILLFIILSILLYLPPVQNWAAQKVTAYASEKTGMDISVGRVSLRFPLDLSIEEFRMFKQNDSLQNVTDTIADVGRLDVDLQFLPLLKKQIEIDKLKFNSLAVNTNGFIPDVRVKGKINELSLESHGIDLKKESLKVNTALLKDAKVDIALSDTVPPDTTESKNNWKIFVDNLDIDNADVTVHLPGDTLQLQANLGKTNAKDGSFDLGKGEYRVSQFELKEGGFKYDNQYEPMASGLDFNHIDLSDLNIALDSLCYKEPKLDLDLLSCSFKEKSGLQVDELSGPISLDSTKVYLPDFKLKTPDSRLTAQFDMDLSTFDSKNPGRMNAKIDGSFGKQDIMRFLGDMRKDFRSQWPNHPLSVSGTVRGNMQRISFSGLNVNLPTAARLNATGWIANPTDSDNLKADVILRGQTGNLNFIKSLLDKDTRKNINIPQGIGIDGRFKADGKHYAANFEASEGSGKLKANVDMNANTMQYQADINARNIAVGHFIKGINAGPFTGKITAKGKGTDIFSPRTQLTADAHIEKFTYEGYDLSGLKAKANVNNGKVSANIDSHNPLFNGNVSLQALTNSKTFNATVVGDIQQLDLYKLRISDEPIITSGCVHLDIASDLKDYYKVQGLMSDVSVKTADKFYRPDDVILDILTSRDTTHAVIDCADFHLNMDGSHGYKRLLSQTEKFTKELNKQIKNRRLDQITLREKLPDARMYLKTGRDNFFVHLLQREGYDFKNALVDINSSHISGLNGNIAIDSMMVDSMQLDTVRLLLKSENDIFTYHAQVHNNKNNPQYIFNALLDGSLSETGSDIHAQVFDKNEDLGVDVGFTAALEENGVRVRLSDTSPILGYKEFIANEDNYLYLSDDKRLSARLQLQADDGTGVQIYTNDDNTEALQDLTLSLHHFDLEKLMSSLPYLPNITGDLDGDFHIIQSPDEVSVSTAMSIDKMTYEGCNMGDVGAEFVYMPKSDGSHYIDGILIQNDREVGTIVGTYQSKTETIDATLGLNRMPLEMANGFIPDQIFGLKGYGEGDLSIKGKLSNPDINGEIYLDSSYLFSQPYGIEMRFANDPVRIVGSHLLFENFEMFAYNDQPLNISGSFDFSNLNKMYLDVRMRARDFELINAKENARSETYGKAFVNFFGMMRGPLDNLRMRGKLDVLGSTDMTYILRDSPLTTDNRLNELVTFVDFTDTTQVQVSRPPINGLDMDLSISIDENAHIKCDLNSDHTNYIDLVGGGDLRMQYNVIDNLRLTGRYTLANGEMKYSLPIIPLKTFTIQDGSYIEFLSDAMNPRLNITATERIKATVGSDGGAARSVDFDCGVVITKTLNDMGLEFIVSAPEDLAITNELNTMSKEERGKIAVTLLTTGMYLANGNTSGFTMNGALSSFLQNEINNLTGSALRTLDLSFGVDNATDASGNLHTDYSFKFSKRFWNNRLRIVVGGKLSTGPDIAGQNQSFFDNVTFEYRLNQNASKYLKLFYNRNSYDWIEGNVGEYGAGFIWRRKLQHFSDIFKFKNDATIPPLGPIRRDSVKTDSIRNKGRKVETNE